MLPAPVRMRRAAEFTTTVRRGDRGTSGAVTAHLDLAAGSGPGPRIGLVVARAVGPAVVRNRVRRRLRHLLRARAATLPAGSALVVRAHPASAGLSSALLGSQLDQALSRARAKRP